MVLVEEVHLFIQPFQDDPGLGFTSIGQQNHKFIPSDAANDVLMPKDSHKEIGEILQKLITSAVAKCIIDPFEIVEIGHDDADRELAAAVQALQFGLKEKPVVQVCEGIVIAEIRETFLDPGIFCQRS